jgi:osmotically-inducible protein OsmY
MTTKKTAATEILVLGMAMVLLTGCSAMLLGEGGTSSPPIGSDSRSQAQSAADEALAGAVAGAIAADPMLKPVNVAVSARSGEVTISGTVSSFAARDQAVHVATAVSGVSRVHNQIRVRTKN